MFSIKRKLLKTKKKNATYTLNNRINGFIVNELHSWPQDLDSDFTIKNCLFGGAKLAKNTAPGKCSYSRYNLGFDMRI